MDLKAEVIDGLNSPLNELLGSLPENEFSKIEFIDVNRIMVWTVSFFLNEALISTATHSLAFLVGIYNVSLMSSISEAVITEYLALYNLAGETLPGYII